MASFFYLEEKSADEENGDEPCSSKMGVAEGVTADMHRDMEMSTADQPTAVEVCVDKNGSEQIAADTNEANDKADKNSFQQSESNGANNKHRKKDDGNIHAHLTTQTTKTTKTTETSETSETSETTEITEAAEASSKRHKVLPVHHRMLL